MRPLSETMVEYIDGKLDAILRAPPMWGSDEAVELQVLQLLEMRALAIRPEVVKARRRPILDPYVGFLRRKFPEAPTMNLAALLEQGGRRGELAAILGEFRNEMVAAIEATRRSVAAPSRSFAMWIESAAWNDVGQRALIVNGSCLGSAPEPGIPLLVEPAFGSPLRAHAADVVEAREGAPRSALMLAGLPAIEAPRFRGAILHEEGVLLRVFSARLKTKRPRLYDALRIELVGDVAWGLLSISLGIVTVAVVGGGLPLDASLWSRLKRLVPETAGPIEREALVPLTFGKAFSGELWAVPTVKQYGRGSLGSAAVVRSAGPASSEGFAVVPVGEVWHTASFLEQQAEGLIHFDFEGSKVTGVDCVAAPARSHEEEESWQSSRNWHAS
jgi:hypothetical protein